MRNNIPKCPFNPPRPPIELCDSFANWTLGIISPSKHWHAIMQLCTDPDNLNPNKARYLRELDEYNFAVLQWKVENRIANRTEWREDVKKKKLAMPGVEIL